MLYLGIDGGGTKCRAIIENESGEIIGKGIGGPVNPQYGLSTTFKSILEATDQAAKECGITEKDYEQDIVGIGLAGVNFFYRYTTKLTNGNTLLRNYI